MARVVAPYAKLVVEKSASRVTISARGNDITSVLTKDNCYNVYRVAYWKQPTLKCFTPNYSYKPVHSLLVGGNVTESAAVKALGLGAYPDPNINQFVHDVATWQRTSGGNVARALIPDGDPATAMVKVMPGGGAFGTDWSFQTTDLGVKWANQIGAKGPGDTPLNGSVAFQVWRGVNDGVKEAPFVDPTQINTSNASQIQVLSAIALETIQAEQTAAGKNPGNVRVVVGGIWSVLLPGDGGSPRFEKKFGANASGPLWRLMHTFTDAKPNKTVGDLEEYLISFIAHSGRILVALNGNTPHLDDSTYVYTETDPKTGYLKELTIKPAPLQIQGQASGVPVQFGLRHIIWDAYGQVTSQININDSLIPLTDPNAPAPVGAFRGYGYVAPLSLGNIFSGCKVSATTVEFKATLCSTPDRREPSSLKWMRFHSTKGDTLNPSDSVDYGAAITEFTEHLSEPDFSGAGGTRGAEATVDITLDVAALNRIAASNGTTWQSDLGAYSAAGFVLGNVMSGALVPGQVGVPYTSAGTGANANIQQSEYDEVTRVQGFIFAPDAVTEGFQKTTYSITLRDPMCRLKDPAGLIGTNYRPLSLLDQDNVPTIMGWQGVQYILRQAIDDATADSLRVYLPQGQPAIFNQDQLLLTTGHLPAADLPLWSPPYGGWAADWLKEIATVDFAALFFAGRVPIYGQYDQVIAGLPTFNLFDGTDANGVPQTGLLPDAKAQYVLTKAQTRIDTAHDYNQFIVWAQLPGGAGNADTDQYGVPLNSGKADQSWTDYADAQATWLRTLLIRTGQFYDPNVAADFIRTIARLYGRRKAASHYVLTIPYATPHLFWGCKVTVNGARDVHLNGRTIRVVSGVTRGNMRQKQVTTELTCVEVL